MRQLLVLGALLSLVATGCVAQVRGVRQQQPFMQMDQPVSVALVSVDVPTWVAQAAPAADAPAEMIAAAIPPAFLPGPYQVVDRRGAGALITLGPDTAPIIQPSATPVAEVGIPYLFDDDGRASAVGAPHITWRLGGGPPGFAVATDGTVTWTPTEQGRFQVDLIAMNARGETPYSFAVSVERAGANVQVEPRSPPAPALAADQAFVALLPSGLPASIAEPLLLGVQVVDWHEGQETVVKSTRRKAFTDVVYTLWTREGREVETRRVRIEQVPLGSFQNAAKLVPDRPYWMQTSLSREWWRASAPLKEDELFTSTAQASASAFAHPYGVREILFSAQLDESSPVLKEGIERTKKDDFAGALESFTTAAAADPQLAGAFFNAGVILEVLGRDAEALDQYRKASAIDPKNGLYTRPQKSLANRVELYRAVPLPGATRE